MTREENATEIMVLEWILNQEPSNLQEVCTALARNMNIRATLKPTMEVKQCRLKTI